MFETETLNPEEQLMLLKVTTEKYGTLHDAQAYQLRRYPFAMSNVKSAEIHISIVQRKIEFRVVTGGKAPREPKVEFKYVEKCVQTLLGDTWLVTVVDQRKKTIFRGRRKQAFTPERVNTDGDDSNED